MSEFNQEDQNDGEHIDAVLRNWTFDPETVNVRLVQGQDGRELLQMRIDLGLLQMEVEGRPDGDRPFGFDSYLDYLTSETLNDAELKLTDDQCDEVDREFLQYYHRRICWLKLQRYDQAVTDADHTLALMDFCSKFSPDEQWSISHEQYRPFVLFHRTQAAALHSLDGGGAEAAITEINEGLDRVRNLFEQHDLEEFFEENELVVRLIEFRESLRDEYDVGKTLKERLADAVASEQYELAAQLRDEISRQRRGL